VPSRSRRPAPIELRRRRSPGDGVRFAVVGCGAVTESLHLPALARAGRVPTVLVDRDLSRAEELAARFGVPRAEADPLACAGVADAAIVAVPIPHHASVGAALLDAGLDVLVEKPLARTPEECDALIDCARTHNRLLMVGLMRRFLRVNRWLHAVLARGVLGPIRSFDVREGYRFDWPVTSVGFFSPSAGGVLKDLGAHTLDLARWFFGELADVRYRDNAVGGAETDCVVELTAGGVPGVLEYSRGRSLRNSFVVVGERATVEVHHFGQWVRVRPTVPGRRPPVVLHRYPRRWQSLLDLFVAEHAHFADCVATRQPVAVPPEDGRAIVSVMERCYATREPLELPWVTAGVGPVTI
jgi:predicted dehydrogenase